MDFNLKAFYQERDAIMNMPDEDLDDYRKRMMMGSETHLSKIGFGSNGVSYSEEESIPGVKEDGHSESTSLGVLPVSSSATRGSGSRNLWNKLQSRPGQQARASGAQEQSHLGGPARQVSGSKNIGGVNQVSGAPNATREENVEGMRAVAAARNSSTGVKRKISPIGKTSPAKRQKGAEAGPVWDDLSVRHTSTPKTLLQVGAPSCAVPSPSPGQDISAVEIEQPSEIKSFTPSPERTPPKRPSSGLSSPISSFSRILTHAPRSDLRHQVQESKKPGSVVETPQGQLNDGVAPMNSKPSDVVMRRNQRDPSVSLIEDSNMQDVLRPAAALKPKQGVIASRSTKLCLEVKERVARHAAMKHRDKVISLGSKGAEAKILGGSSIKKDQVQCETSILQTPLVTSSRAGPSHSRASEGEELRKSASTRRSQARVKQQNPKNTKKEKPQSITPADYAQSLLDKVHADGNRKSSVVKFLEGKSIYYIGGDMQFASERTRGRMDLIVKHGGSIVPTYDPGIVTHIVTDTTKPPTLRALGYKCLSEIPDHIPTVKWSWILSAIGRTGQFDKEDIKAKMEDVWLYAAFSERMDITSDNSKLLAQPSKNNRVVAINADGAPDHGGVGASAPAPVGIESGAGSKGSSEPSSGQITSRHNTTLARPARSKAKDPVPTSLGFRNAKEGNTTDPLQEFYAEARAARENNWSRYGECEESDEDIEPTVDTALPQSSSKKPRWTCDEGGLRKSCANQDIIDKLQELQELHKAKPGDEDHWRAFSYSKSIRALRAHPKRIQSYSEARSIRSVGDKTALKIMEILQTGDLRRINYEKTDDVKVTRLFQGIYGVGQSTAFKWYSAGCRTLQDLQDQKGGAQLSPAQLIGLQYYDDINTRMPRSEAKAIFDLIRPIALSLDSKLFVEIMGSYRRGKADCGDIDILITRPTDDGRTHSGILARLLPALHKAKILTEDLALPENFTDLECIYRGLCRLPQIGARRRRIDFLTVPWKNRGAALLYYTGDDIFNRAMRMKANKMGYSLNQRGLCSGIIRDPKNNQVKLNEGTIIASETEEEIFRILHVPWQEPHERVRG